MGTRTM